MKKLLLFCIWALLFASCDRRLAEKIDVPIIAIEKAKEAVRGDPCFVEDCPLCPCWWELFHDGQLTQFIQLAFARNPTLQAARANIALGLANAGKVRSSLFPYIWWGGDVSRQKLSKTGVLPLQGTDTVIPVVSIIPVYFTLYETQLNLTYNFDIWGKNRNAYCAALGEVKADIADEAFSRLQLGVSLAEVYFALQIDYKRLEIAERRVQNRETYLKLQKRRSLRLANDIDLIIAENSLSQAREIKIAIIGDIAVNEILLKTYLAGNFQEEIVAVQIEKVPLPPVPLPKELPLHLIARRPDIMAQLWLIESACKKIKVAKAGFYPDFNLMSFFGFQTIHFHELFRWASAYFDADAAFTLPLFDAGYRMANLRGSQADYDVAVFKYNDLVLNATKEVLDGIAVLQNSNQQLVEFNNQSEMQRDIVELTHLRVTHNLESELVLLDREQNFLIAEDNEMIALGNTYAAILSLIEALGGGYDACCQM